MSATQIGAARVMTDDPREIAIDLLRATFQATGPSKARYLCKTLVAIALAVGVDLFAGAMCDSADQLLTRS